MKKCLLIHSFYNGSLAETYILNGKGLGFLSMAAVAVLTGFVLAIKVAFFASEITPGDIRTLTARLPQIEIRDGRIVEPKDFFQRIALADGVHVTLDTTDNAAVVDNASSGEIYISKDAVHFINGNRVELLPLNKFVGAQDATITPEDVHLFVKKLLDEMYVAIPSLVFVIAVPLVFFKYVLITYFVALLTYLMTIFPKVPLVFEQRMRWAAVSTLPVFVINAIFGTMLSWFTLGAIGGVAVVFVYLFYYLMQLPKEICVDIPET